MGMLNSNMTIPGIDEKIDDLIIHVNHYKNDLFDKELNRRAYKNVCIKNDNDLLKHLSEIIVYSQQAKSSSVSEVIEKGYLNQAFENFESDRVAKLNPCDIVDKHWDKIKGIRQQTKTFQIVMLARKLNSNPEIYELLLKSKVPKVINEESDFIEFWKEFDLLKEKTKKAQIPFFRETTSLLHLLVTLGYDCVKPDSAVMNAANKLKIVEKTNSEADLRKVVKTIQAYSIRKKRIIPPMALDLYLLIHGGQTDAKKFVSPEYYEKQETLNNVVPE